MENETAIIITAIENRVSALATENELLKNQFAAANEHYQTYLQLNEENKKLGIWFRQAEQDGLYQNPVSTYGRTTMDAALFFLARERKISNSWLGWLARIAGY